MLGRFFKMLTAFHSYSITLPGGGNRVGEVTEGLEKVAVGSGTEKVPSEKHGSSPTQLVVLLISQ